MVRKLSRALGLMPLLTAACAVVPLTFAVPTPAQAQKKEITLNSFKSSTLWPIFVAQKQGFFDKQGIVIKNVYTPNSTEQMVGLLKGDFQMVTTALDNVVAYNLGDGAPQAPKNVDLIAVMGGTNGANSLIAQPEIKSIKELKGRDLAVDAISTGYAFVLQEILAKNGVANGEYKLVAFGNTPTRFKALQEKKAMAALLSPPVSLGAVAQGYVNLADAAETLGGYQGTVIAATREWSKNNADTVVGVIRAYRQGLEWLRTPANKQAALDILRAELPETSPAAAERTYGFLVTNPKGFDVGGKLDLAGAKQVLELRRRYGPQGKPATDISRHIDESYFERAARP